MRISLLLTFLFVLCIGMACAGCTGQQATKSVVTPVVTIVPSDSDSSHKAFQALPQAPLNESELADIQFQQESEKLVYDLNNALYGMHNDIPVFKQIADSAKVSMLADDVILQRYNLTNPETNAAGTFNNPTLQQMYTADINTGLSSSTDALKYSAKVEDMQIADLTAAIGRTDNSDVQLIYRQQLAEARNDMRAINQWLTAYNAIYTPTYITQSSFNDIINTPMEQIPVQ